jgi:acetyl esterase/lipase
MTQTMYDRLDPELIDPLQRVLRLMGGGMNLHNIPATRDIMRRFALASKKLALTIEGVDTEDRKIPGPDKEPDVAIRIYQPTLRSKPAPALLWIHGGGFVLGTLDMDEVMLKRISHEIGCVICSVEYRLAPEHPFPAPLEDCYSALKWLSMNSRELNVDRDRIAVGGDSAGGGLAACLALLARDRAEVNISYQLLIYPTFDDRNIAPASPTLPDTLLWTRENNFLGWQSYLGKEFGSESLSPYAAAMRAKNLTGLPPAYIAVGELDLFLQENIVYSQRLLDVDIPTELHIYPGAFHGFDSFVPGARISQRFTVDYCTALKHAWHI